MALVGSDTQSPSSRLSRNGQPIILDERQIRERETVLCGALDLKARNPVPFLVEPFSMWYATEHVLHDHPLDLARQLEKNVNQLTVDDYSLPHLKPGTGLGTIATAFGCGWREDSSADPWVLPLIKEDPQAVYQLQMPDPKACGCVSLFFAKAAFFQAHSNLPMCTCNIPSPLTTASMIWDYSSFLAALIECPREVHYLLELVTEYTVRFLKENLAAIDNLWAMTHMNWYIPREYGLRVSDDVLAVLSPAQYREFGVPYNNRLARIFGGIVVHSCGNVVHNLSTILETESLRGIDITLPHNDINQVAEIAAGRTALMLRYWVQDWKGGGVPDLEQYTEQVLSILGTRGILLEMQVLSRTPIEAQKLAGRLKSREWLAT